MSATDLAYLSLSELFDRLARHEVSSVEATRAQLERIAALDGRLNVYITVLEEAALAQAVAADARRKAGESGPLLGIPLALKDLFETAGVRTTAGARVLADNVPAADATVVRLLRGAGAVFLGKTNMMEFAYGYPHPDFGETRNPWAPERTAGGSSGGSAAAVAAGLAYGALGSDTGGSIRSPAAYCGLVGLKPSHGRVSRQGVVPLAWSLDYAGPLARTVRDAALIFEAIADYDPADPDSVQAAPPDALSGIGRDVAGMRVGVDEALFAQADREVAAVARQAVDELDRLGVVTLPVELPALGEVVRAINPIVLAEAAAYHAPTLAARPDDYSEAVRHNLRLGLTVTAIDYLAAQQARRGLTSQVEEALARCDLLICPTQPIVAPPLDAYQLPYGEDDMLEREIAYTGLANLTGHPALTIPCGFTPDGLPIGLQLTGRLFDERTIFHLAAAFEAATNWHTRHPAL